MNPRSLEEVWMAWGWRPEEWVIGLSVQSENPRRNMPPAIVQELADLLLTLFPHTRLLWLGATPPALTGRALERIQTVEPYLQEPLAQLLDGLITTIPLSAAGVPVVLLTSEEGAGLGDPAKCAWGSWPCGEKSLPCLHPDCLSLSRAAWEEALHPWQERYQQRQFRPKRVFPSWPPAPAPLLTMEPSAPPDLGEWARFGEAVRQAALQTGGLLVMYSGASSGESGGGQRPAQWLRAWAKTQAALYVSRYETLEMTGFFATCTPEQWRQLAPQLADVRGIGVISFPDAYMREMVQLTRANNWPVVYDCIDFWPGFTEPIGISPNEEEWLCRQADLVVVSARRLEGWVRWLGADWIEYLPNAASPKEWDLSGEPDDLVSGEITLLYSGHLTGSWIDQEIFQAVAVYGEERGWALNLIGHRPSHLIPGVHYLGEKPYTALGRYLSAADVALIPFRENVLTDCVSPLKVFDYLCAGVPVVSTYLSELDNLPYCFQACSPEDFCRAITRAIHYRPSQEEVTQFREEHSWDARCQTFRGWMRQLMPLTPAETSQLTAIEERVSSGLYQPEETSLRAAWLCGTECNYQCPYCYALDYTQDLPFTELSARAAWERIAEKHGKIQIQASGLEAMSQAVVRRVLAGLSKNHVLDINSNMSFPLKALKGFNPENVYFSSSFHPTGGVSLPDFLEKLGQVGELGFHVTGVSCVLYPPHLPDIEEYQNHIGEAGYYFLAHAFNGHYAGKDYPSGYTEQELAFIRQLLSDEAWTFNIASRTTAGQLCLAGSRYFFVHYGGKVWRCPFVPLLPATDFFQEEWRPLPGPTPCTSVQGCHCNDLWRYLLTVEEAQVWSWQNVLSA